MPRGTGLRGLGVKGSYWGYIGVILRVQGCGGLGFRRLGFRGLGA